MPVKTATFKKTENWFSRPLSLNAGQKHCRMLQGEHSAILSTFIKLPFVFKIFILSIFEWPFYTSFTVYLLFSCRCLVCVRGQNGDNLRLARAYTVSQNRYGEFTKYFREATVSLVDGGEFTKYFREPTASVIDGGEFTKYFRETVSVVDGVRL